MRPGVKRFMDRTASFPDLQGTLRNVPRHSIPTRPKTP